MTKLDWKAMQKALSSSDPSEVMEAYKRCCEYSFAASSFTDIRLRALETFRQLFCLSHMMIFKISGLGTKLSLSDETSLNDEVVSGDSHPRVELETIESQLRLLCLTGAEIRQGVNAISIANQQFSFFVLGSPHGRSTLIMWPQSISSSHTYKSQLSAVDQVRAETLMETYVCQLQTVCQAVARMEDSEQMLQRDDLTGLYNYRSLEQTLDAELKRYFRFKTPFSLLFIDLDNFKPINDTHGHLVGSDVLKQVAAVLCDTTRDVDSVFRYGGDEFVVMLIESTSDHALKVAERLRTNIGAHTFRADSDICLQLTASIGVASCPDHGKDRQLLLQLADDSMYRSKRAGKNQVHVVEHKSNRQAQSSPELREIK